MQLYTPLIPDFVMYAVHVSKTSGTQVLWTMDGRIA